MSRAASAVGSPSACSNGETPSTGSSAGRLSGAELEARGVTARIGDLASMTVVELAAAIGGVDSESWRERDLGEDVEYYSTVKNKADIEVCRSDLDWLILRPSLFLDVPEAGTVSLGPAESHGQMTGASHRHGRVSRP